MELKGFSIKLILLKQTDGNMSDNYYDFSKYVQIGFGQTLPLDDTIDTMALTLVNMPFSQQFDPTSLFRVTIKQEFYDEEEDKTGYFTKEYDYALESDAVEKPNMAEELYTHNLKLSNPAIVAQQKTVDNIAVTYKLQDVLLESNNAIILDLNSKLVPTIQNANYVGSFYPELPYNFGRNRIDFWTYYTNYAYRYVFSYPTISYPAGTISENNRGVITNKDISMQYLKNLKQNYLYGDGTPIVVGGVSYPTADSISFNVPLLQVERGLANTRNYDFMGYLPVDVIIQDFYDGIWHETTLTAYPSKYLEIDSQSEISYWVSQPDANATNFRYIHDDDTQKHVIVAYKDNGADDVLDNNRPKNRTITINFDSTKEHQYIIKIQQHKMHQQTWTYGTAVLGGSPTSNPEVIFKHTDVANIQQDHYIARLNDDYELNITLAFNTYPQTAQTKNLFKQSAQVDAYYLFKKAQLAVATYRKESGVPYYNTNLPFYVSDADKTLLQRTQLIESDFNGKNLWEVFSEIGKYIHAKPKISIETDENLNMTGRFLVSFLYYGKPNIYNVEETTNSVFNSRFAEEYICELDNYVENYFNLGSYVVENLHISSESEDGLIYNDVAKLITKYPILEVLSLEVINTGGLAKDITKFVFEYTIYKTLDYSNTTIPSKNKAIYYHLGSNVIEGMQFVTPKQTGVECAYSMKNIIAYVYNLGSPDNITIHNYVFRLKYRVKDNVRVSITRPDIRKYLLNSAYDLYPIHTQFNQQQDKIISSDSFGLNAYGKLIRTGNTTYSYNNWTNDINKVMNEGDLYKINNELYYVSKVNRVYYPEHIEETVELTKDFNRLSQIIGIPSQPRFYEISERNIVNRDVKFNEYIVVSAYHSSDFYIPFGKITLTSLAAINAIFNPDNYLVDGVITMFKGDVDKEYDYFSNYSYYETYTPVVAYSSKNTLTYEWDMEDNFSAGDKSVTTSSTLQWSLNLYSLLRSILGDSTIQPYRSKQPTRYVDLYGRCDLVDFIFTNDYTFEIAEYNSLPSSDIVTQIENYDSVKQVYNYNKIIGGSNDDACWKIRGEDPYRTQGINEMKSNSSGFIIAKDNREKLSFNYNIQLLLDSDRIVLGNKLWIRDLSNTKVRVALLDVEISKYDSDVINSMNIIAMTPALTYTTIMKYSYHNDPDIGWLYYYLDIESVASAFTSDYINRCKSYAVIRADEIIVNNENNYRIIVGRNVSDLDNSDKLINFYLTEYSKEDDAKTNRSQLDDVYNELYN